MHKNQKEVSVDECRANGEGSENVTIKMNVLFFKFVGVYCNSLKMAKVVSLSLELNSVGTALKQFGKRKKIRRGAFTPSKERLIRKFHVMVVQQRNTPKSVLHL